MITPNKFISLDHSILSKLEVILNELLDERTIADLYETVHSKFETANDFILAIDVLYILNRIEVDFSGQTVRHAD